jgi:hypothetical protein
MKLDGHKRLTASFDGTLGALKKAKDQKRALEVSQWMTWYAFKGKKVIQVIIVMSFNFFIQG